MRVRGQRPYRATIFLGAFLLFLIQPLIARVLLPYFGGASAVWATSLVFFTTALFIGYAYAHWLSRFPARVQAYIHLSFIALAALLFAYCFYRFSAPLPPLDWAIASALPPALKVLVALAGLIGVPYILLAATGPLVQQWYAAFESKEPYHLYALSNAASFIALGAYPFIIEPSFTLSFQKSAWVALFAVFALFCTTLTLAFARSGVHTAHPNEESSWSERLEWLSFAMLPAALLVATTSQLTQAVAPVPFLWVIPLALYLLSFMFAFKGYGQSGVLPALVVVSAGIAFSMLSFDYGAITRHMLAYLAFFFLTSFYCNAELYASRPLKESSSLFYVWIAFGGALGTLAAAIGAPLLFRDVLEFPLGILLAAGVAITLFPAMRYVRDEYERGVLALRIVALVCVLVAGAHYFTGLNRGYMSVTRNFYGVVKISQDEDARYLYNGTTFHGDEFLDDAHKYMPTTYYTSKSGIGLAFAYERAQRDALNVGVIGLGSGSSAAYCKKGDRFAFYDIDPRIADIARAQFYYLGHCAGSTVRIGDGRLLLAQELRAGAPQKFDLLAVDAFSDDTIPTHLLTAEALQLYLAHLHDAKSILAIHVSNRYLNLSPVVARIAQELHIPYVVINNRGDERGATSSRWVLLARDKSVLAGKSIAAEATPVQGSAPLWTDDYMNVFAALQLPSLIGN